MQPLVRAAARRSFLSLCCQAVSTAPLVHSSDSLPCLASTSTRTGLLPHPSSSIPPPAAAAPTTQQRHFFSFSDDSKVYNDRRLVGYSPEQMYAVVSEVQDYHKFVPFCLKSQIVRRAGDTCFDAELEVGFQLFYERYTSKVTLEKPRLVRSTVSDHKLFDHLDTSWHMQPGPTPASCWLSFKVDFAFRSPLYKQAAELFFQEVVKQMASAFEVRCKELYGPSSLRRGGVPPLPHRPGGTGTGSGAGGKPPQNCGPRGPLAPAGKP